MNFYSPLGAKPRSSAASLSHKTILARMPVRPLQGCTQKPMSRDDAASQLPCSSPPCFGAPRAPRRQGQAAPAGPAVGAALHGAPGQLTAVGDKRQAPHLDHERGPGPHNPPGSARAAGKPSPRGLPRRRSRAQGRDPRADAGGGPALPDTTSRPQFCALKTGLRTFPSTPHSLAVVLPPPLEIIAT